MAEDHLQYSHLSYSGKAHPSDYTHPQVRGSKKSPLSEKNRITHAVNLLQNLTKAVQDFTKIAEDSQIAEESLADFGLILKIESEPGYSLKHESFDQARGTRKKDTIELLNIFTVQTDQGSVDQAAVYVPYGKLEYFSAKITNYKNENPKGGPMTGDSLWANVASIGYAALEALWTETKDLPQAGVLAWWEVWIRRGNFDWETQFIQECEEKGIHPGVTHLKLPEHTIRLIQSTRENLEESLSLLNCLAEVRFPRTCSLPFTEMSTDEQAEWQDEAINRITLPELTNPSVCLLDSGINRGHPLLENILSENDMHTVHVASGTADRPSFPHGTQMAGLAAYGNLTQLFNSHEHWIQTHRLESVKVLKNTGNHEPELYGYVTQHAISLPETQAVRPRIFCNSITAPPSFLDGRPSSWSAAIDAAIAGRMEADDRETTPRRLLFTAAGNLRELHDNYEYPESLLRDSGGIEDPAQAWNAITVGATTRFDQIHEQSGEALRSTPIAQSGNLGPTSRTSSKWTPYWPYKPDIVMEGGNLALNQDDEPIPYDSLRPLTTSPSFPTPFLTTFSDTSCATALAACLGAKLQARYPDLWPETIRGLVVHSARWSPQMLNGLDPARMSATETKAILRKVGWGEPDEARALSSGDNAATIICENEVQPFHKVGSSIKTNQWHIHALPWPTELLLQATNVDVTLRLTLSYFIEPNPGSRSLQTKGRYRYANCNLRFELKGPTESEHSFQSRLNSQANIEDEEDFTSSDDTARRGWALGTQGRRIGGSLHQDIWKGSAAELARMDQIAVLPVTGWWRTRKFPEGHEEHHCHEHRVRYSLIVSMESESNIPIYSTLSALINVPLEA